MKSKRSNRKITAIMMVVILAISVFIALAPTISAATTWTMSPVPFTMYGQVFDIDGVSPVDGVTVTVTNIETGSSVDPTATANGGWYLVNLGNLKPDYSHSEGDRIQIFADDGAGKTNTTVVLRAATSPQRVDLILQGLAPEPPVVTNPSANPDTIYANEVDTSRLNVTVTDNVAVDMVTVDLTSIGGPIKVMAAIAENVYSTETTAAAGTPPGTYYLKVNATDIDGNYNGTVDIILNVETPKPSISISTDKTAYAPGDIMNITLSLKNPTADSIDTYFIWYFGLPDYGYWTPILVTPLTLPPNFDHSYDILIPIGNWGSVGFNATWYVALLETAAPYEIISWDTADWRYAPIILIKAAPGEAKPEEIAKEIMKTVEEVELPR